MMVKMPFSRKKSANTEVPKEISDYYQAEKKQRVWAAWLLTIGTFIVTVVLVIGLFAGGRWVFHRFGGKKPQTTVTTQEDKPVTPKSGSNTNTNNPPPTSTPATTPPASSTTQPSTTPTTPQTPKTTQVPNTGPGNIAAVFAVSTVLGTFAYQIVLRRRVTK